MIVADFHTIASMNASHGKSIKMSPQVPINGFTKLLMHLEGFLSCMDPCVPLQVT